MNNKGLKLTDILVTIVIAIVFGIVYKLWTPVYYAVKPFGLHFDQLIYGMWFIAATVAFLIIRKPGVALIAEIAAASGEFIVGSEWGLEVLIYGVLQGLFAEFVFAAVRYKRYDILIASLAAIASAIASLLFDYYKGYLDDLVAWNLLLYIVARVVGSIAIAGVFAYYLVKALEATGVTNLVRPASKEDYDALDK
ncbi:ECF transporter S component [Chengkuizengella marina]|uniref:Thiamine ABC transporter permease n=1 Tax=Chengkuizengella marina TaxID=2507566 RepID=A0A6N9Q2I6_9BACL|nr:ECF transporter S component [Chengkuizengella marina]NBI28508.1 thiamine ABC transporter permease [Chengkuizengella marina]